MFMSRNLGYVHPRMELEILQYLMREDSPNQLSDELVARLATRGDLLVFPRGTRVLTEGDEADALYVLVSGELKVFTQDGKGRELVYNVMHAGEFFGELFLDGGVRSASVAAVTDARCVRVDRSEIRAFMKAYPEFAECLALKLIERLRQATELIKSLAMSSVHQRTVRLLEQLAVSEDGHRVIPKTITQQEIANRVGATREMVNHVIRKLARDGYLAKGEDRRLTILKDLSGSHE